MSIIAKKGTLRSVINIDGAHCLVIEASLGEPKNDKELISFSAHVPLTFRTWKNLNIDVKDIGARHIFINGEVLSGKISTKLSNLEKNIFKIEFTINLASEYQNEYGEFRNISGICKAKYQGLYIPNKENETSTEMLERVGNILELNDYEINDAGSNSFGTGINVKL